MEALLLVDLQNDFLPGGSLAVPRGDEVLPVAQRWMERSDHVVATQDWHPPDHLSFAANHSDRDVGECVDLDGQSQILWPVHCVQGTDGAEFSAELDTGQIQQVVRKGTQREIDSYSGFFDNGGLHATGLEGYLRSQGIDRLAIMGLATDYCVKFTVLDACQLGFATRVILAGCRGVDLQTGDIDRAITEMQSAGARIE